MIGNLSEQNMTRKQFDSLLKLTKELRERYNIPVENVLLHGGIEDEQTECPGKRFPKERLLKMLTND